jgi:hypothetical protein
MSAFRIRMFASVLLPAASSGAVADRCVEGFEDFGTLLGSGGWIVRNQSHDAALPSQQVYYRWSQLGVMPGLSAQSEPIDRASFRRSA